MTDRELDALVAEKVMQWQIFRKAMEPPYNTPGEDGVPPEIPKDQAVHNVQRIPDYSTSISDAWEVVEKLQDGGPRNNFWWQIEHRGCLWRAIIYEGMVQVDAGCHDTAPRAICLAALRAVGVEVEG